MQGIRTKIVTVAAVGAAIAGGAAFANAATSGSTSSTGQSATAPPQGPPPGAGGRHAVNGRTETPLSGDTAKKVRAAALAKVSGTVERVETNVDSSAPYEAHIRKADGTEVEVQVSRDFKVAAVNDMPGHP